MDPKRKTQQAGFTMMELMVVVVIIGVLSSVAVPSIMGFIKKSRESEATHNMSAIVRGAQTYYNEEQVDQTTGIVRPAQYPRIDTAQVRIGGDAAMPRQMPCQEIAGSPKYSRNSQRWFDTRDPWRELKFSIATSHYFQYRFFNNAQTAAAAQFRVRALADLDCDGTTSLFQTIGQVNATTGEQFRGGIIVLRAGE